MPTFEVKVPVGANQIWMKQQIKAAVAEATQARQAAAELGRFDHGRELRQQPRARDADPPLRAMGEGRDRGEADPEGRRLREHQRAVRAADRARSPRARRPFARRRSQVHPARGVEGAGQGMRPGRRRRVRRRRPHVGLPARQGTAVPHARRHQSRSAPGGDRGRRDGRGQPAHRRADGIRRRTSLIGCKIGALNRLPASFFVSVAYDCWAFRRLGVVLDARTGAITSWLYRDGGHAVGADVDAGAARRRVPAHGPRSSRCRRRSPRNRSAR